MSSIKIHNPHDSFFKHVLSNLTAAKDFIQAHFDPEITKRLQWDTLRLSNKSYIDEKLKHLHSDMVYTCQLDTNGPDIYILIEHQSKPDNFLPFRFMQYNMAILTRHRAQSKQGEDAKLPIILYLCLYSGKATPYPCSVASADCFIDPTLASVALPKPLHLVDLGQLSEAALKEHGKVDLLELLLKQSQERTLLKWLKSNPTAVERMLDDLLEIYGTSSIIFILAVERKHSAEEIIEAIGNIVPYKKGDIMTAAQQLHRRGMQQGIQRGMQQGIQRGIQQGMQQGMHTKALDIAKNMLSKGLAIHLIRELAGVSEEDLTRLREEAE
jgi:predicted transposase/invertase (TIGR01784 family)